MKGTWFVANSFNYIVDVVVHCSSSVVPLFCCRGVEFVVVIKVHGAQIKATETSMQEGFIDCCGCGIAGNICDRHPCLPTGLPMMAVDEDILLGYMDCWFTESVYGWVVDRRLAQLDVQLSVQVFQEFQSKLQTTIGSYISQQTIQFPDVAEVRIGNLLCCPHCFSRNIVLQLCKAVCNNQDCIEGF